MSKEIEKKSILGGAGDIGQEEDPLYQELKKIKTPETQEVEIVNPMTGNKALITLNRDGTTDEKVAALLIHPEATKEQKDTAIAAWLFERGRENSSFLMELFQSKGQLTRETRSFKTQMRFDFEEFVNMFTRYLEENGNAIFKIFDFSEEDYRIIYEESKMLKSVTKAIQKRSTVSLSSERLALLELAVRFKDEAEYLREAVKKNAETRMKEKGYGIYIDSKGEIYTIFDKDFDEKVKKDKEELLKTNE